MTRRILVPFDGSAPSSAALEEAIEQCRDGEIIVLHALDPVESHCGRKGATDGLSVQAWDCAEALLAEAETIAHEVNTALMTAIETGRPERVIVEYADDHAIDGIVMGSHGHSGLSRLLLGSKAETIARRSSVPVTIVS